MTMSEVGPTGYGIDEAISGIAEIQQAILLLPETDYIKLREWISDLDWDKWDKQVEADAGEGALDFLIAEVFEAKEDDTLQEL